LANEIEKTGQRMYEAVAKLRAERPARPAAPSPSFPPPRVSAPAAPCAGPPVFLEWGACAVHDRPFVTRIEQQPSGLYLRVACEQAHEGEDYGGVADSRVLRLDQIRGSLGACPWCGDRGEQYQCHCGVWICGGRVDKRRNLFRCRDSCGRAWEIGEVATETQVSEEARRGDQWKAPRNGSGMWQAPTTNNPARRLLPPAKGPR